MPPPAKFEQQPDMNKPPEIQEPVLQDVPIADKDAKKPKDSDHPVGRVEIHHPPKVEVGNADKEGESMEEDSEKDKMVYTTDQLQFFVGLSLVVGFIFMLLVDECGGGHSHNVISGMYVCCQM